MKHELKIIMTFHTEDIDHDQSTPIHNYNVVVSMDDQPVGCIQKIKFAADCKEDKPEIEVTFPDLGNLDYDMDVYNQNNNSGHAINNRAQPCFVKEVDQHIKRLKLATNLKIKIEGIDDGISSVLLLNEVGTDGDIDHFPIKRRHSI